MQQAKTMVSGGVKLLDDIEMSEPGNALRLAITARGEVHYIETLGVWYAYRDGRWQMDPGGVGLQEFALMVPQGIYRCATHLKPDDETMAKPEKERTAEEKSAMAWYELHMSWATKSNTEPQVKRTITLARHLQGIRISHEELDAKPWLFNMLNGTFNFETGKLQPHDPGDLLTKMAPVWYDPDATAPLWLACLNQWQRDHGDQKFLQEIAGSAMTGHPVQNLFVNWGEGRNGKGTFYRTLQYILGEYASTLPEDMLIESRFKVHDEEKARLRGCRMLLAPETGAGDRLDEAGIKNLTGGDLIHGRHLYGRPFDFKPTHTAFLHTNHEPQIKSTSAGIWSRVLKIGWNNIIPSDQRDEALDDKLKLEWSGILNWFIAGALRFRAMGMKIEPSPNIRMATEEYRASQDTIKRFLDDTLEAMVQDACQLGPVDYIPTSILRKHYEAWCLEEGTHPWSAQSVARELRRWDWTQASKRVGKVVIRIWEPGPSVTPEALSPAPSTSCYSVTDVSLLNPVEEQEIEKERTHGEVNRESLKHPEHCNTPTPEDREITDHREWLRVHGYPVPPTEEEIEAWYLEMEDPPPDEPPMPDDEELERMERERYLDEQENNR